ncbi:MAG: response regulator [Hyphomonadaceae bacterium]
MTPARPLALVIEDDPASSEALTLLLRDWGAEVIQAKSQATADAALSDRFDELRWIITDFHLGDEDDGVSIASRLNQAAPHARVLVLSGSFRKRAEVMATKVGYEVLQKPARAEAILAWLEKA